MASDFVDLVYQDGRLMWPGGSARAACGRGGVRLDKREGDGASPQGIIPLVSAYYRPDRIAPPASGLKLTALCPEHGWCDDPGDPLYNRPISLPCAARHERLWREDGLYDLVVVIGYNIDPPVPGLGSAIFLHAARPDFAPTEGCIAIERDVLAGLLARLGPERTIAIRP
jgi:L,D-peptidoglycan transpeptidase YkuD (ErfK/YbiS/YcfS/YnhG family)